MNFLQRIFRLDRDQRNDPFTYIGMTIAAIILIAAFITFIGSWGIGASWNFVARNARWAGWGWKVAGAVVLAFSIWFDLKATTDTLKLRVNESVQAIIMFALFALLILVNCGFRFDHF